MGTVTVSGAGGGVFSIPLADATLADNATLLADVAAQAIGDATALLFTVDGSPMPAIPAGQQLVVFDSLPIPVALPDTAPALLFSNAVGITTITSGAAGGDNIVVGDGGVDFTSGAGAFNLIAGNGDARLTLAPGVGGGTVRLGDGNATINAVGGSSNFILGNGNHQITLGIGSNWVLTGGNNTVIGGPGGGNIYNDTSGSDLIILCSGTNGYETTGSATITGGFGTNSIQNDSTGSVVYFAGPGTSRFTGAGTVVGGSGDLYVTSASLVFAGPGATSVAAGVGASTIIGNPSGTLVLTETFGNSVLFAQGATTVQALPYYVDAPLGSATVLGISGTITATSARGLFLAAPGGNNTIDVTSASTVFGAAAGDVLSVSDLRFHPYNGSASNILVGGAGAETISGAGSTANNTFFAGSGPEFIQSGDWSTSIVTGSGAETIVGGQGISLTAFINGNHPDVVIQGFDPNKDYLTFINYAPGEAAAALAAAQTVLSNETITLSDGTHITLQGFTGLTSANIL